MQCPDIVTLIYYEAAIQEIWIGDDFSNFEEQQKLSEPTAVPVLPQGSQDWILRLEEYEEEV